MISVEIVKDRNNTFKILKCKGHAGYADSGEDIVCSAVSMLVINTINSIEHVAGCGIIVKEDAKKGLINMSLKDGNHEDSIRDASLFIDSLILGLNAVINNYGNEYVKLVIKEV